MTRTKKILYTETFMPVNGGMHSTEQVANDWSQVGKWEHYSPYENTTARVRTLQPV